MQTFIGIKIGQQVRLVKDRFPLPEDRNSGIDFTQSHKSDLAGHTILNSHKERADRFSLVDISNEVADYNDKEI